MTRESNYEIILSPQARRSLNALPPDIQQRLNAKIIALALIPRPPGVKAMQGKPGLLRLRVGKYRIIYRVEDDRLVVIVVEVGHRREVYRRR